MCAIKFITFLVLAIINLGGCAHKQVLEQKQHEIYKLEHQIESDNRSIKLYQYMLQEQQGEMPAPPECDPQRIEEATSALIQSRNSASLTLIALKSNCNWAALRGGKQPADWTEWPIMPPWQGDEGFWSAPSCTPTESRFLFEHCETSPMEARKETCESMTMRVCLRE